MRGTGGRTWPWWAESMLVSRHRAPAVTAVLAVVTASVIGTVFPLLVVLFTVASRGWVAVSILCAAAAMFGNLLLQPERTLWVTRSYGPLLLLAVALVLGMWARSRRRLVVTLAEQVDHLRWSASCAPSAPR